MEGNSSKLVETTTRNKMDISKISNSIRVYPYRVFKSSGRVLCFRKVIVLSFAIMVWV